jgi:sirohydrochlorin ferrochelatase
MPTILLVDNGSRRAGSTISLRRIARELSSRCGQTVHPVSLQHADKVPAELLDNTPADTFEPFMLRQLENGERSFIVLPLFFGPSRALTSFIPEHIRGFEDKFGAIDLRLSEVLCPLPQGEPRLTEILSNNIEQASSGNSQVSSIILVDHGSPIPEVTAVRDYLGNRLKDMLKPNTQLYTAVMERRAGREYDFNGILLEEQLDKLAQENCKQTILLAMLFMSPGRHAGPQGDIAEISQQAEEKHPGLKVVPSALIGEHPLVVEILSDRLGDVLASTTT